MNRSLVFGALVATTLFGHAAFADTGLAGDISIDPHPIVSTRSRADVQKELAEYQRSGVNPWSIAYNPLRTFQSTRPRADVQQEYTSAREAVHALGGEDGGATWRAQHRSTPVDHGVATAAR
ncbi:DUF4148 domain-containing protein [Ramlibacter ginsenosidimutans]|uniref:DUF4148 domain-containing protein n=1 Tax=Ramlibacter ginsenosidimutans TaxID=502333 RepID=A0A934WNA0_9BURK|nr:DUF4148 domain-containing protein [Ramlibacter ginsenosidimutans]MBK6008659.1 DUF4148 domain-containing protein [Ramlibacter ginsenosidimutans]